MQRQRNNFDAIRLMAAMAVIFDHSHALTGAYGFTIFGASVGEIAVKVFFVISGYLVYTSWCADPSLHRYLTRRALRIFPALAILCLITVFVIGPIFTDLSLQSYFPDAGTYAYLRNALLYPDYQLPGMFRDNIFPSAVNGSLWTLPIEFAMYLLLPIACGGVVSRMTKFKWLLPAFCIVFCMISVFIVRVRPPLHDPAFMNNLLLPALNISPYFFLGASFRHLKLDRVSDPVCALFLVMCAMFLRSRDPAFNELFLYLLIPYVVMSAALSPQRLLSSFGRYGDVSYGVYIYAFVVQQCVAQLSRNRFTAMENAFISVPFILVLAWLSWHLVEKRALALKPASRVLAVPRQCVAN